MRFAMSVHVVHVSSITRRTVLHDRVNQTSYQFLSALLFAIWRSLHDERDHEMPICYRRFKPKRPNDLCDAIFKLFNANVSANILRAALTFAIVPIDSRDLSRKCSNAINIGLKDVP